MYTHVFFNDTATTEIYTLSLHDALPICADVSAAFPQNRGRVRRRRPVLHHEPKRYLPAEQLPDCRGRSRYQRSEEHTSELQSRQYLVCRLLLEKKNH